MATMLVTSAAIVTGLAAMLTSFAASFAAAAAIVASRAGFGRAGSPFVFFVFTILRLPP